MEIVWEAVFAANALLGVGPEAAIRVRDHRLFIFWLPIPVEAVFYPI